MKNNDNKKADKPEFYPWATLYSIESNIYESGASQAQTRVGRPASPMPRRKSSTSLTDEESRIWDDMVYTLKKKMYPAKVQKNQVMGFALRVLDKLILEITDKPYRNWEEVAHLILSDDES